MDIVGFEYVRFLSKIIPFLCSRHLKLLLTSQLCPYMLLCFLATLSWRKLIAHEPIYTGPPFFAAIFFPHTPPDPLAAITSTGLLI